MGGFVQNLVKETLPLHEVAKSVGIELPSFLGSSAADASVAPKAPETKA